jgi:hypothetical protein
MNVDSDNYMIQFTADRQALSYDNPTMASIQTAVMQKRTTGTVHKSNDKPLCT